MASQLAYVPILQVTLRQQAVSSFLGHSVKRQGLLRLDATPAFRLYVDAEYISWLRP